ncbi:MAG: SpoIVB peptidase, partial [Lachnospiraceae bacterium]|nr:SpoIVB peptidase [Lachnospiraceae bacterium]
MERMWIIKKKDLSEKEKRYRMLLWSLLACAVSLVVCVSYLACWKKVPGRIHIRAGQQEQIDFGIPASGNLHGREAESIPVSLDQPVTFFANEIDSYEMDVKLFGVVPLKKVDVHVIEDDSIIPAGIPIGIYVKTEGVLVVGTGEFTGYDGRRYAPSEQILCSGDYILCINGTDVTGKKMFMSKLREAGSGEQIFTI